MIESNVTNNNKVSPVSWGAIFAGLVVALVISLVLALLGLAIGLWSINPTEEAQPLAGLGVGSAIWWVLSSIIALFAGGWVAGRLCGFPQRNAIIHGIVTWGLTSLLTVYLVTTSVGALIGGAFGILQQGVSALSGAATGIAQTFGLPGQIQQQLQQLTRPGGEPLTQQEQQQILQAVQRFFDQDGPTPADREAVANLLAQYTEMSQQEARQMIDQWISTYESTLAQATQTAEQTAQALGTAAFWAFIMLLLTAIAAGVGAAIGTKWRLT